jgi:hypothetical protein
VSGGRAPDAIDPIRAWRVWLPSVEVDGSLMLCSLTEAGGGTRWAAGDPLRASCPTGEHEAPRRECTCGIYAHKSWASASHQARGVAGAVVGEVQLWGRVIEHERGYRAQFALPCALWLPVVFAAQSPRIEDVVDSLSRRSALDRYQVPVGLYNDRTGLALDSAELRRIFVREPRPPVPLPTLLWRILWGGVRLALISAAVLIAMIADALSRIGAYALAISLPLAAGTTVFRISGAGLLGTAMGVATTAGIALAYACLGYRFELIEKTR